MPELPEVQTIISDLQSIVGDQFTDFFSDFPKAVKYESTAKFKGGIHSHKIKSIERLGKIILINLDNKKSVAIHLKMTGQLLLNFQFPISNFQINSNVKISKQDAIKILNKNKHIHHLFILGESGILAFSDVRKFATISMLNDEDKQKIKSSYGPDPIADNFSAKDLLQVLGKRQNKPIKSILMDNSVILGIGNIYASEILFEAKIAPMRLGKTLDKKEIQSLHASIKKILTKAIKLRGTSVSDYRDSAGKKGSFQHELKVYKKHGQKCKNCDTMIEKIIIGQRSSFHCPNCQK